MLNFNNNTKKAYKTVKKFMSNLHKKSYKEYKGKFTTITSKSNYTNICICIKREATFGVAQSFLIADLVDYRNNRKKFNKWHRKSERRYIASSWQWIAQFGVIK